MKKLVKKVGVLSDSQGLESRERKPGEKTNHIDDVSVVENQSIPNLGWLFYKNYYRGLQSTWFGSEIRDAVKKEIKSNFDRKNDELLKARFDLSENVSDSLCNVKIDLKTVYPGLTTGVGVIHETGLIGEIKLGFQFDYTTGLPYIPGTSVKGLLRSMFPYSLKENKKKENDTKVLAYRKERTDYIAGLFTDKKLSATDVKALEYAIFNGCDVGGKKLPSSQKDVFLDAFPIETGKGGLVGLDYITPHTDVLKNPNPIQFLKIMPEVTLRFSFKLYDTVLYEGKTYAEGEAGVILKKEGSKQITKEDKLVLFQTILNDIGIGAKTNVGYGQFEAVME